MYCDDAGGAAAAYDDEYTHGINSHAHTHTPGQHIETLSTDFNGKIFYRLFCLAY